MSEYILAKLDNISCAEVQRRLDSARRDYAARPNDGSVLDRLDLLLRVEEWQRRRAEALAA